MAAKTTIPLLLVNGPNLNLLGRREPELYGDETLPAIEQRLRARAAELHAALDCYQSNAEHELVDRIQRAGDEGVAAIVINPGGYTHTSVALRDTLLAVAVPFIEIHLSNIHARERFRRASLLSDVAAGVIAGLGPLGYELALTAAVRLARHAAPDRSP